MCKKKFLLSFTDFFCFYTLNFSEKWAEKSGALLNWLTLNHLHSAKLHECVGCVGACVKIKVALVNVKIA